MAQITCVIMKSDPLTVSDKHPVNYPEAGVIKQEETCRSRIVLFIKKSFLTSGLKD